MKTQKLKQTSPKSPNQPVRILTKNQMKRLKGGGDDIGIIDLLDV